MNCCGCGKKKIVPLDDAPPRDLHQQQTMPKKETTSAPPPRHVHCEKGAYVERRRRRDKSGITSTFSMLSLMVVAASLCVHCCCDCSVSLSLTVVSFVLLELLFFSLFFVVPSTPDTQFLKQLLLSFLNLSLPLLITLQLCCTLPQGKR